MQAWVEFRTHILPWVIMTGLLVFSFLTTRSALEGERARNDRLEDEVRGLKEQVTDIAQQMRDRGYIMAPLAQPQE